MLEGQTEAHQAIMSVAEHLHLRKDKRKLQLQLLATIKS